MVPPWSLQRLACEYHFFTYQSEQPFQIAFWRTAIYLFHKYVPVSRPDSSLKATRCLKHSCVCRTVKSRPPYGCKPGRAQAKQLCSQQQSDMPTSTPNLLHTKRTLSHSSIVPSQTKIPKICRICSAPCLHRYVIVMRSSGTK